MSTRTVVIAVVLVALMFAIFVLGAVSDDDGAEPAAPESPSVGLDIDEIAAQVSEVRGLPVEEPVEAELLDDEEFGDFAVELGERREAAQPPPLPDEQAARILETLRFVPPGTDLDAIGERLQREGLSGLYVPEDQRLYVLSEQQEPSAFTQVLTAHEVTHALQDQSFDLTRLLALTGDQEAFQAFSAVVEGDASLTMDAWSQAYQTPEQQQAYRQEAQTAGAADLEALSSLPPYTVNSLLFPYVAGALFVTALQEAGGQEAVDAALREPPTTTAEIFDPQRYLDGVQPEAVPPVPGPPNHWTELTNGAFGAFDLSQMAVAAGEPDVGTFVQGWNGGTTGVWTQGDATALGVRLRFDDEAAAAATCDLLPRWYATVAGGAPAGQGVFQGDRDVLALACESGGVRFGLAPDAPTAQALVAG